VNVLTSERESAVADQPQVPPATTRTPAAAPVGWRWEAYENVQMQVPADWATSRWWALIREPATRLRVAGGSAPAVVRAGFQVHRHSNWVRS
jgi:hypothetical protein